MKTQEVIDKLKLKFSSGNAVLSGSKIKLGE
jgi:hypothetical protein